MNHVEQYLVEHFLRHERIAPDDFRRLAYQAKIDLGLRLGHTHQLVAKAMGYNTLAHMQAAADERGYRNLNVRTA